MVPKACSGPFRRNLRPISVVLFMGLVSCSDGPQNQARTQESSRLGISPYWSVEKCLMGK